MRLVVSDGRVTVGTFAVRNDRFLVTLRDGSHQQIYFSLTATTLTLKFPDGRSTVFSRVR